LARCVGVCPSLWPLSAFWSGHRLAAGRSKRFAPVHDAVTRRLDRSRGILRFAPADDSHRFLDRERVEHQLRLAHLATLLEVASQLFPSVH
jgi:hypothetical protein